MFDFKEKENNNHQQSPYKQTQLNFSKKCSKNDKHNKLNNLRQLNLSQPIQWSQPISAF